MLRLKGNPQHWLDELTRMDDEIIRLAWLLNLPPLQPLVIDRVIRGEISVRAAQQDAFDRLRRIILMRFHIERRAVEAVGASVVRAILDRVFARLREKYGSRCQRW